METNTAFKPSGYNSVSPYFITDDAQRLMELLIQVFNGTVTRKFERPDGKVNHAEVKIDDSIIMLSQATESFPANQFMMHVYVPDVHGTFQKAVDAGCQAIKAPVNEEGDPDVRGMFRDFAGNVWAVGMQQ